VLGAGNWGTTLAHIIGQNGFDVTLWCRDEDLCDEINNERQNSKYLEGFELSERIHAVPELEDAVRDIPFLLLVVPSKAFREVCTKLAPLVSPSQSVLHATKGIEFGTYQRMSEILHAETCIRQIGVLSGPNIATEIMEGKPSGTVVASPFPRLVREAERFLVSESFRVYVNDDVVGVELGGALKNIIAIAGGIAAELELGENAKSLLITRGLGEILRIGAAFNARPETFSGLAGIGDLMVTCASRHSRNHRLGRALATGKSLDEAVESLGMVAEGVYAVKVARAFIEKHDIYAPVVENVHGIVHEGVDAMTALRNLMAMDTRPDVDLSA
jgi:glycerol-3-phosphate dehydrogenase (NAD(P)+)